MVGIESAGEMLMFTLTCWMDAGQAGRLRGRHGHGVLMLLLLLLLRLMVHRVALVGAAPASGQQTESGCGAERRTEQRIRCGRRRIAAPISCDRIIGQKALSRLHRVAVARPLRGTSLKKI